jgi:hypothetical protein
MQRANVFTTDFEYDDEDPPGFRSGVAMVGKAAGGTDQAVKLFELPPGESLCPYHYGFRLRPLAALISLRCLAGFRGRDPRPTGSSSSSSRLNLKARPTRTAPRTRPAAAAHVRVLWSSCCQPPMEAGEPCARVCAS